MADYKSLEEAAAKTSKITNGALDYLIINGAYLSEQTNHYEPTEFAGKEELLKSDMLYSTEVNVVGTMYTINAFLGLIRKGSVKKIISISSGMADPDVILKAGAQGSIIYAAAKAALNMVIVKYAIELKPEGIALMTLSPGIINTRNETRKFSFDSVFSGTKIPVIC